MKVQISEAYFKEPVMRGADSCSSLNIDDTNLQRREKYGRTKMELDTTSGVLTILYHNRRHFVGSGNLKWAGELQAKVAVKAPVVPEIDEDEDDEVTSPFTDAEEVDDMPDDIPAKKHRAGPRKG